MTSKKEVPYGIRQIQRRAKKLVRSGKIAKLSAALDLVAHSLGFQDYRHALRLEGDWPFKRITIYYLYGVRHVGDSVLEILQDRGTLNVPCCRGHCNFEDDKIWTLSDEHLRYHEWTPVAVAMAKRGFARATIFDLLASLGAVNFEQAPIRHEVVQNMCQKKAPGTWKADWTIQRLNLAFREIILSLRLSNREKLGLFREELQIEHNELAASLNVSRQVGKALGMEVRREEQT